jgi:hypothetical protein
VTGGPPSPDPAREREGGEPAPADAAGAETYLRLLAEAELRRAPALTGPGPHPHRVWLAASTLAAAGVVDTDVARHAVADFEAAAGVRVVSGLARPWTAEQRLLPSGTGQEVTLRAVPAGLTLRLPPEREGWYGELRLIALVMTDTEAALTVATRWAGQARRSARPRPSHAPFHVVGALDDGGQSYRAGLWDMGIEDGREWWDCHLGLSRAAGPGARWLEVGPGAAGAHARVDLTAPPTPAEVTAEPVPPVSGPARLLDSAGDDLLCAGPAVVVAGETLGSRIAGMIRDLTGCGAAAPDDPAVLRLAAVGQRLGLDLGTGIAAGGPLPEAWTSLLADGDARDGPDGIAPFAVVLPRIDGASFALAGLRSSEEGALLHVMASGWEPHGHGWLVHGHGPHSDPPDTSLSWRARDSTGRWHLVHGMSWGGKQGMIQMHLTPPLHPAATSLEVIVTGTSRRVRATVPLAWQAA